MKNKFFKIILLVLAIACIVALVSCDALSSDDYVTREELFYTQTEMEMINDHLMEELYISLNEIEALKEKNLQIEAELQEMKFICEELDFENESLKIELLSKIDLILGKYKEADDILLGDGEYSLKSFKSLADDVLQKYINPQDKDDFEELVDDLILKLARATCKEDIVKVFDEFKFYTDKLISLADSCRSTLNLAEAIKSDKSITFYEIEELSKSLKELEAELDMLGDDAQYIIVPFENEEGITELVEPQMIIMENSAFIIDYMDIMERVAADVVEQIDRVMDLDILDPSALEQAEYVWELFETTYMESFFGIERGADIETYRECIEKTEKTKRFDSENPDEYYNLLTLVSFEKLVSKISKGQPI